MNHLEYSLVLIVISLLMNGIAIFRLRPKALEGTNKFVFAWKSLLILSLLLLGVGASLLFIPPELWWPRY